MLSWNISGKVSKMMSIPCLQKTPPVACCVLLWIIYHLPLICHTMKYYKCDSAWQNNETLKNAIFNNFSIKTFPENVMHTYAFFSFLLFQMLSHIIFLKEDHPFYSEIVGNIFSLDMNIWANLRNYLVPKYRGIE